jgi:hypothetical protein
MILFKRLMLRELSPICKKINPCDHYRFCDYVIPLESSCLNENPSDRKINYFWGDLALIKKVNLLTHDIVGKFWTFQLEEPHIYAKEWARGLGFFPQFKKWALSFNHTVTHKLVGTFETRLER